MSDGRTTREVAELVGAGVRTLQRWRERGFVSPGETPSGQLWWMPKHCREASVLASLRRAGVSNQQLRQAVEVLKDLGHNPTSTGRFLVKMKPSRKRKRLVELLKLTDEGGVIDLLKRGEVQAMLPLWWETEDLVQKM